ncbi:CDP-diacylglycerol--glycerol-3-phosphate 3-phosphatidyltransferase [Proteiniclasticum sp. QWL-01]|uniref:CDP-diacylglycerol--glycerol-3-phosphate 3-phosphatidyltransferase n=1 Tax=Proteiniclasticum sp. QWL-01 TaxID=3036945 RepID=UPI00220959B6|nr:CDP-diacylglycerol--glycerol-3-phosphate 3-phosphatidyltransferase [Proteiniclasticum sp. QWL-01]UUM11496.1 CDP-diacylglycerol--glycerol-3-phosphate 3-phosphatidyltransferase [Clostridiaceae bacterium HFYG-1003]WFF72947.1 CDP-diacylglycerol--glycerol-3-phosphate 3-phosphatidyltransferase [Proteiniclasticum sp. QWL-01]
MSIPNIISIFRILLIPLFIYTFVTGTGDGRIIYPIIIFIISGISDVLDGYIARTYHMETKLGAVLDPLADKLMLITALICFAVYDYIPYWIVILVALKELFMIGGGIIAYQRGIVNRANAWGKMATFLFHISIVMFLVSKTLAFLLLIVSIVISFSALFTYVRLTLEKKKKMDGPA